MNTGAAIEEYLAKLGRRLSAERAVRARILHEVRDHLTEATAAEERRGTRQDLAVRRAIKRFGTPVELAQELAIRTDWARTRPGRVVVVGVGGAGSRVVGAMAAAGLTDADALVADCDAAALERVEGGQKLVLGEGRPLRSFYLAQPSTERDAEAFRAELAGAEVIVIVAGLGGHTASGAAVLAARVAAASGALTVAVATLPLGAEGERPKLAAGLGRGGLRQYADAVVEFEQQRLVRAAVGERPTWERADASAFRKLMWRPSGAQDPLGWERLMAVSSAVLHRATEATVALARGVADRTGGDDPRALLAGAGLMTIGIGGGTGGDSAAEATRAALTSPSIDAAVARARRILCCVAGDGLDRDAAAAASQAIAGAVGTEARVAVETVVDARLAGRARSVVLAGEVLASG